VGRKLKFVLSDLHLGAGYAGQGGNYLEDFTTDEQLVDFLRDIKHESRSDKREIELIINGDFFEFLQVPAVDHFDPATAYPKQAYLDSSEAASVKRLSLIVKGHPEVFNALSDFMHVEPPQRRITLIKGNHDVNLYWPRVKSRLREALGASGSRSSLLLFAEKFVSREYIYVEHGHQQAEKMNSYHDHIDPRLPHDPMQLYYPLGSHFVIDFFNEVESTYPFVDSVKPFTALVWFALQWDFEFAAKMLSRFIHHAPALAIGDFHPDEHFAIGGDGLLQNLEDNSQCRQLAIRYENDPSFRQQLHQQIKQYLADAIITTKNRIIEPEPPLDRDPVAIGRAEQAQQQAALRQAAEAIARQEGARVVLFGHSHHPQCVTLETGSLYINTGCWPNRPDLANASVQTWQALFNDGRRFRNLPYQLPYARLDYDEHNLPAAQLLNFTPNRISHPESDRALVNVLVRALSRFARPHRLAGQG
jgi:UDP-2,3-diacylglucosamine pyrophosphatase LpxH